jgi:hypothetical protein
MKKDIAARTAVTFMVGYDTPCENKAPLRLPSECTSLGK